MTILECYLAGVDDTGDIAKYLVGMDSVEGVTGVGILIPTPHSLKLVGLFRYCSLE